MTTTSARDYAAEELLRDGGSIVVRAIRPDDKARLADHFTHLSPRSVYFRFLGPKKRLTDAELTYFTELDFVRAVGLVATLTCDGEERIVGVGRYNVLGDGASHRAEVAFAVVDEHQGRGIGTLLLDHLARIARRSGITEFDADVLGENNRMLQVFARSGFTVRRSLDAGVFRLAFPTEATPTSEAASAARARHAAAESVRALLEPRSVAIVGASRDPGSIGAALLRNVRASFRGPVHPVHPSASEVDGLRAHPRVSAIGAPVDLAIVAVPAAAVVDVLSDCARAGVRGVVVISSGFGETPGKGPGADAELRHLVRGAGMRLVGPNCLGILNTDPVAGLNATFAPGVPPVGSIAMLSQSGAMGLALLDRLRARSLGVSSFVSVGNKADVSSNDLLAYWVDDPRTAVILLYLESFGNPRRFARVAPEVARRKPVVAVKSGRSAAGMRAASSHSAALAASDAAVDALFEQAGVIRTRTLEEMFDVAVLLATQPPPRGGAVGVVTNAGGLGIMVADACEGVGLQVPELAGDTRAALRAALPPAAAVGNPVDLTAAATPQHYEAALGAVGADPAVDAVIVVHIPVLAPADAVAGAIARGAGTVPAEKPVLAVVMSGQSPPAALAAGPRGRLPAYAFPENAALALGAAHRWAAWRRRPEGTPFVLDRFAADAARAVVARALATTDDCWLGVDDVATVLRALGVRQAVAERAAPAAAVATAERLGYPLVVKAIAPGLLHKSDVGGVRLGLRSAADVARAVADVEEAMRRCGAALEGVLLQREVTGSLEALVGVATDPTFGPLLVCGLGGVLAELLGDVSIRLTPVTDVDATAMLASLRGSRLFDGYRGGAPADRAALVDVMLRVAALVEAVPELRELDLNPVEVLPPGAGAVVVDARMRVARA